jgi:hypothetical protein
MKENITVCLMRRRKKNLDICDTGNGDEHRTVNHKAVAEIFYI